MSQERRTQSAEIAEHVLTCDVCQASTVWRYLGRQCVGRGERRRRCDACGRDICPLCERRHDDPHDDSFDPVAVTCPDCRDEFARVLDACGREALEHDDPIEMALHRFRWRDAARPGGGADHSSTTST